MLHIFKKRSVRFGIPFILFILSGAYGLKEFQSLRYKYKPMVEKDPREMAAAMGIKMRPKDEVTTEKIYEEMKKIDINNWENKRIPRPYDE